MSFIKVRVTYISEASHTHITDKKLDRIIVPLAIRIEFKYLSSLFSYLHQLATKTHLILAIHFVQVSHTDSTHIGMACRLFFFFFYGIQIYIYCFKCGKLLQVNFSLNESYIYIYINNKRGWFDTRSPNLGLESFWVHK